VWLLVYHLTCDSECRKSYGLNAFRKEQLLRLRKYLNDVVLDQVPVLADVMRYMDELALMAVPENSTTNNSGLMMQQVASTRDKIVRNKDWPAIAEQQYKTIWSKVTDAKDEDVRKIGGIYDMEGIEDVLGEAKPYELNSLPITKVTVCAGKDSVAEFKVKAGDKGTVVDTADDGKYTRFKLVHVSTQAADKTKALHPNVPLAVLVEFDSDHLAVPHVVTLTLDDAAFETGEKIPAKVWKQVGGTPDKLVCQIAFERIVGEDGYGLGTNVFISQPVSVDDALRGLGIK
jgi:hypothetical protein